MNAADQPGNEVDRAAANWLARRDRGLSATEQDAYLQWLRESPAHGEAVARLEQAWRALDALAQWRPAHSPQPNPDLLAPPVRRATWAWPLALAAALICGFFLVAPRNGETQGDRRQAIIHPGPERLTLEDGSIVELNTGAKVSVRFTPEERRVQLERGEAHFTVAKNPARPFIVSADRFAVRAVGTAFSVQLNRAEVSVLVTEGRVRLDEPARTEASHVLPARELSQLVAGQLAVIRTTGENLPGAVPLAIREVTPVEMERSLSWQGLRLEFGAMPLRDVVQEFNRYNVRKLVIDDNQTGAILVQGNFRADNVDAFVRLLDLSFGVTASPRGAEIVLRRSR